MASSTSKGIESRGTTVEAAVTSGLQRLGLRRDQVEIIVIDEGSRGLLGIGSREAIVRLTPLTIESPAPPPAKQAQPPPAKPMPAKPAPDKPSQPPTQSRPKETPRPEAAAQKPPAPPAPRTATEDDEGEPAGAAAEHLESERQTAIEIISTLLEKMHVKGQVTGSLTEPDDLTGQRVNIIDISGEDLSMLIGPRGETLDSLQFISRLMVAHRLHRRANFVVDVEGFRQRREQALSRLAERMADKARKRGEPIALEPMSAYERRVIHMTLRNAGDVYTESTGEGKQRRVRIIPKK